MYAKRSHAQDDVNLTFSKDIWALPLEPASFVVDSLSNTFGTLGTNTCLEIAFTNLFKFMEKRWGKTFQYPLLQGSGCMRTCNQNVANRSHLKCRLLFKMIHPTGDGACNPYVTQSKNQTSKDHQSTAYTETLQAMESTACTGSVGHGVLMNLPSTERGTREQDGWCELGSLFCTQSLRFDKARLELLNRSPHS